MALPQQVDELAPYVIRTLEGLRSVESSGAGCYGSLYRVRANGFPCIAKRLHDILVGRTREVYVSDRERAAIQGRFREECILLSKLHHPNIVQFIGVHYGRTRDDLSLVMECLYTDLAKYLQKCVQENREIPLPYQLSILLNVAYGLLYLHSRTPPIVHRDLTANNILLTQDMTAKLADLGVSKILGLHPLSQSAQTVCPGTQGVMPPEALVENPQYSVKLDDFSFGTLVLHVTNYEFPLSFEVTYARHGEVHIAKRRHAIDKMGSWNILYNLVIRCLQDDPRKRPTTAQITTNLERLCEQYPKRFRNLLEFQEEIGRLEEEKGHLLNDQQRFKEALCDIIPVPAVQNIDGQLRSAELDTIRSSIQMEVESLKRSKADLEVALTAARNENAQLRARCTEYGTLLRRIGQDLCNVMEGETIISSRQGYTTPSSQGYFPPPASSGQGYTPPTTQGYFPPPASSGQGYTPPTTQGYTTTPSGQGHFPPPAFSGQGGAMKCLHCPNPGHPMFLGMCQDCYRRPMQQQPQQQSLLQQSDLPTYANLSPPSTAEPPLPPPIPQSGNRCRVPGCEFYGTAENRFYCSVCFRENLQHIQNEVGPALPTSTPLFSSQPQPQTPPESLVLSFKVKRLCRTAGCSFNGQADLEWLCVNCYEDQFGKLPGVDKYRD